MGDCWVGQSERQTFERRDVASAFNARLMPLMNGFASQGLSRRAMVVQLNDLGIKAALGRWGRCNELISGCRKADCHFERPLDKSLRHLCDAI